MSVVTWNINGIRATRGGLKSLLDSLDADVVCLQETKVTRDLLDEPTAVVDGYNAYFSFSRVRSGYSGVATYCRDGATPVAAEEGLSGILRGGAAAGCHDDDGSGSVGCYGDTSGFTADELQALDAEGRAVLTQHRVRLAGSRDERTLTVVNVYCPRADPERPDRGDFKLRFYRLLQARCRALREAGSHVIVLGDLNTAHRPIDHCDPEEPELFKEHPGRQWLDQFLCETPSANCSLPVTHSPPSAAATSAAAIATSATATARTTGDNNNTDSESRGEAPAATRADAGARFVDAFRHLHPARTGAFTCWCNVTGARLTNYGTRIDYVLADAALAGALSACEPMPHVLGSDHCPVRAALALEFAPSRRRPALCARLMPEFAGRQRKLSAFLAKEPADPERRFAPVADGAGEPGAVAAAKAKRAAREPLGKNGKRAKAAKAPADAPAKAPAKGTLLSFLTRPAGGVTRDRGLPAVRPAPSPDAAPVASPGGTGGAGGKEPGDDGRSNDLRQGNGGSADFWKSVLKGLPPAPLCRGHGEPCLLRTVKKPGQNFGRRFYVCPRPEGHASNKEARCNSFTWVAKR